jgi:hypothetical protein
MNHRSKTIKVPCLDQTTHSASGTNILTPSNRGLIEHRKAVGHLGSWNLIRAHRGCERCLSTYETTPDCQVTLGTVSFPSLSIEGALRAFLVTFGPGLADPKPCGQLPFLPLGGTISYVRPQEVLRPQVVKHHVGVST